MKSIRDILEERLQKQAEAEEEETGLADEVAMYMDIGYKLAEEHLFDKEGAVGTKLVGALRAAKVPAIAAGSAAAVGGGGYMIGREQGREAEAKEQMRRSILTRLFGPEPTPSAGAGMGGVAPMEGGMTSPYAVY